MEKTDDINSILNAVNEINLKTKKKNRKILTPQKSTLPSNRDLGISPDVDRLILEAEKYQKKSLITSLPDKTIIKDKRTQNQKNDTFILIDEAKENSSKYSQSIKQLKGKINSLKIQENKLRKQLIDLEQDKILYLKRNRKEENQTSYLNFKNSTKEILNSIYKQVENQKKIFIDLKKHSIKTERESNVFKENYERLIIENNEIKTRLKIAKEQIVNYETNKTDLLTALDQLNEILSKNNIVGINPQNPTSKKLVLKKEDIKSETSD